MFFQIFTVYHTSGTHNYLFLVTVLLSFSCCCDPDEIFGKMIIQLQQQVPQEISTCGPLWLPTSLRKSVFSPSSINTQWTDCGNRWFMHKAIQYNVNWHACLANVPCIYSSTFSPSTCCYSSTLNLCL